MSQSYRDQKKGQKVAKNGVLMQKVAKKHENRTNSPKTGKNTSKQRFNAKNDPFYMVFTIKRIQPILRDYGENCFQEGNFMIESLYQTGTNPQRKKQQNRGDSVSLKKEREGRLQVGDEQRPSQKTRTTEH